MPTLENVRAFLALVQIFINAAKAAGMPYDKALALSYATARSMAPPRRRRWVRRYCAGDKLACEPLNASMHHFTLVDRGFADPNDPAYLYK